MRRRQPEVTVSAIEAGLTPELLLGPCLEVWCPTGYRYPDTVGRQLKEHRATGAWRQAVSRYLRTIGVPHRSMMNRHPAVPSALREVSPAPWSFDELAVEAPAELSRRLRAAGLPLDWEPPRWTP